MAAISAARQGTFGEFGLFGGVRDPLGASAASLRAASFSVRSLSLSSSASALAGDGRDAAKTYKRKTGLTRRLQ